MNNLEKLRKKQRKLKQIQSEIEIILDIILDTKEINDHEAAVEKDKPAGRWLIPIIPELWEAKAGGQEFEISLVNMVKNHLY